jgi:hypothetical protein
MRSSHLTESDFDIENEVPDNDEESGSEESADENAGTEHYVTVGYAWSRYSTEDSPSDRFTERASFDRKRPSPLALNTEARASAERR